MSLSDHLNMTVQIARETTTPNGMGGISVSTTLTTISNVCLWQNGIGGRSNRYTSGNIVNISSHSLVLLPDAYTFTLDDHYVIYKGKTFKIKNTGMPTEDIDGNDFLIMVDLERVI